jgi:hypothetical protein
MLTSVSLLIGCTRIAVDSQAPAPYFPSCTTIAALEKDETPNSAWRDWVMVTNIMLKLRELQPEHERDKLVDCKKRSRSLLGSTTVTTTKPKM